MKQITIGAAGDGMRRKPNRIQSAVLRYIKQHPKLTTDEIATHWNHSSLVYNALAFLWLSDYAVFDDLGRLEARDANQQRVA